jgi:hypothetical protein
MSERGVAHCYKLRVIWREGEEQWWGEDFTKTRFVIETGSMYYCGEKVCLY